MRISDWSSDVCSSDLLIDGAMVNSVGSRSFLNGGSRYVEKIPVCRRDGCRRAGFESGACGLHDNPRQRHVPDGVAGRAGAADRQGRSEEHTSELQQLMSLSYAVFCWKKQTT